MRIRMGVFVIFILICGLLPGLQARDDAKLPPLNEKVLAYCNAQKGKQIGNGECWTLADQALAAAGAHRPGENGYALYVFGRLLKADEPILPGDIVQFTDARFVTITETKEIIQNMTLHTGIVAKVDGTKIDMLNQNIGDSRIVQVTRFNKADLKEGKLQFFRPQPAR